MEDELELIEATYPSSMEIEGSVWRLSFSPRVEAALFYEGGFCGNVRHLPPISLSGDVPEEYPVPEGLDFSLEASFLPEETVENLRVKLEDISHNSMSMVFFEWLTFLDTELRDHLGSRIDIPAEALAFQLLAFDKKLEIEEFARELHTCNLCFDDKPGSRFTQLNCREQKEEGESHFFCTDCLQSMAKVHIDEGTLAALKCPVTDCTAPFPEYVIRKLLDSARYERWERLVTSKAIDQMGDIVFCPTCTARKREVPVIEEADHLARCTACQYIFCGLCLQPYHPGTECISGTERLEKLRAKGNGVKDAEEHRRIINEMLNIKYLLGNKNFRSCPSCKMKVEKIEGCNKMVCGNCSTKFCWKCQVEITGYDHFQGSCELFGEEVIRDWERNWDRRVNENFMRNEVMRDLYWRKKLRPDCVSLERGFISR
eukprot:GEMP01054377.1.p1 GENE.GEMP01054377.1~~GEMP01054377.1.p1  ORF type:complete len:429 (+),score=86.13 GEMP01054377.1:32-1318(+)